MQCIRCGKEMENTSGGNYECPSCRLAVNDLVYRPSNCDMPMPQGFGDQGWICPVCGRGVAPHVNVCPCQKDVRVINITTNPNIDFDLTKYYTLVSDGTVPEAKFEDLTNEEVD